jgi:hypothetical protein
LGPLPAVSIYAAERKDDDKTTSGPCDGFRVHDWPARVFALQIVQGAANGEGCRSSAKEEICGMCTHTDSSGVEQLRGKAASGSTGGPTKR